MTAQCSVIVSIMLPNLMGVNEVSYFAFKNISFSNPATLVFANSVLSCSMQSSHKSVSENCTKLIHCTLSLL